jgi:hypothetical protein
LVILSVENPGITKGEKININNPEILLRGYRDRALGKGSRLVLKSLE